MPLLDAEYLRNGRSIRDADIVAMGYKKRLTYGTHYSRVSFQMSLNDLERLSKIFNDTTAELLVLNFSVELNVL